MVSEINANGLVGADHRRLLPRHRRLLPRHRRLLPHQRRLLLRQRRLARGQVRLSCIERFLAGIGYQLGVKGGVEGFA